MNKFRTIFGILLKEGQSLWGVGVGGANSIVIIIVSKISRRGIQRGRRMPPHLPQYYIYMCANDVLCYVHCTYIK